MKHYTLVLLIGISLYACGQKGDLFLAEPEAPKMKEKIIDPSS
jgi:predicted small lipoprotein YifL